MAGADSFTDLMARLRAGDQDAAAEVFHLYAHRLAALARARLDAVLRRKEDPEDVLQSVFKSFFLRQAAGQFELHDWDSLWGLLARITAHKCGHRIEHFRAARRDVRREAGPPPSSADTLPGWEALAREPSPEEAACLTEMLEEAMRGLDDREREVLALSLQGHTPAEISAKLGRTERTVYRLLARVRERLEGLRDAAPPP